MSGGIVHDMARGQRESQRFDAVMLLVAQGFVTLIGFIMLYFGMTGLGCPGAPCTLAAVINIAARWGLLVIFAVTALLTLILVALGRASVRLPFAGAIVSTVLAACAILTTWLLPGMAAGG